MLVRRSLRLVGALALATVVAAGCASTDAADTGEVPTRVFAADNGDVTIPVDPQRVVATGYAVPALIEADANLVGISTWERGLAVMTPEDRATYDGLEKVAGAMAIDTNYEAVATVDPDLIVIGVPQPALVDIDMARLESIAPVVVIGPTVPAAWRELSRRQSDAAGRLDDFEASRAAYEDKAAGLREKYGDTLAGMKFGHLGAYGDTSTGTFQREFADSWGTNIAQDVGVEYPGEVQRKEGGSKDVAETPSLEMIPESFAEADAITYTVEPTGAIRPAVQQVLDSPLWQQLPAVQAGRVYPIQYSEAATYASAQRTLDSIDASFEGLTRP
ncbi:ABC transporter substrate-binding protein [Rhodococcus triatomae]|uniref:Iron complex transport system substrate-binding protein n=1 Tax=Rhodococcus triatomae TaxID=300028 RepID=A0A1G8SLI8_9NOCA|nr:ABC transporter substrate-binding protein [Rhodococcus triatomae]QNG18702.1 ABC transporter substrate-binding protein [Rhodococcus triatomae]QNG25387.1 ABC transporter substrate-binding protein [Rhodococcus triatomae]SDJ29605.1 iron complex transport system substrate-binding protein [Rhodococcus triatomae]